ncbi:MAG: hypothetical protein LGL72_01955 [Acidibrevibacterium sp.]|jgi:hypothetical protein|uniref:hypothetical protein n=1 Tax=Acidibrevibacterium TaxID=2603324 RepID=UPI0023A8F1D2|nr:hypothetical protein [Acidibrevibacterium fodinaquatile]MCA7118188.1 hypothetical protein [Acidibrevibacterium fodinaquatile]
MAIGSTQPLMVSATATLAAGTTSTAIALAGSGEAVLVYNASAALAFIRFGMDNSVTATSADVPIPPGSRMLIHAGEFAKTVAAVLASGSGSLYFSRGQGTVY